MKMKDKLIQHMFVLLSLSFLLLPSLLIAAIMEDYCAIPPYVKRDVSLNIMLLMDNSIDMLAPAHTDDTYCPSMPVGNTNCWDTANNRYYKEYMGHFPPRACYTPGSKFTYGITGQMVNFTTYPDTGCPPGKFNGNRLNWITMSRYTIAKKVMTGEASTSTSEPFEIEGRASYWPNYNATTQEAYKDSDGCRWWIKSSPNDVLSLKVENRFVAQPCLQTTGGYWDVKIEPTAGIEDRTGVLQEFTDVNPKDLNFDKGSPRFGITKFSQTGVTIDVTIPPGNFEPFINAVKTMGTRANNDLATAHYTDIEYFKAPANVSTDPYKGCAGWESPPCVQGVGVPCRKSFILMITTGTDVTGTAEPSASPCTQTQPLERNSCYAFQNDLRADADLPGKQNISTYVVQTFGSTANQTVLQNTAALGAGNYYLAGTDDLDRVLRQALQDIIKRAAAGTAASVLASGEGSGANLVQAVFYPRTQTIPQGGRFDKEISWIGRLQNLWYYIDPFFRYSGIREDTTSDNILNLGNDYIAQLYFDTSDETTKAKLFVDANADGAADSTTPTATRSFEDVKYLWEAGLELWKRNLTTSQRTIYIPSSLIGTTPASKLEPFSTGNASQLLSYFDLPTTDLNSDTYKDGDFDHSGGDPDSTDASVLISYLHGQDIESTYTWLRSRKVAVDLNGDGDVTDTDESAKIWKLGDVLNSTPRISSWIPLNTYDIKYWDTTYKNYVNSSTYTGRGMVFTGANDGMLHAFKLGTLELSGTWKTSDAMKAKLSGTSPLGKEEWAFIPKNAIPYLKYLVDPGYCHIYTVDLSPYIFDASINGDPGDIRTDTSWKTILIGGMRLGGACKAKNLNCSTDTPDSVCAPAEVSGNSVGYSSYFALDVTDQSSPKLLWEFSDPALGFASTGPAVIRVGDRTKNGNWFVVFGSGPTGPISTIDQQFLGRSDQNLKFFVLNLKDGTKAITNPIDTGIPNAFANSMLNATVDTDLDYNDDVLYVGYVKKCTATTSVCTANKWENGGVGRLMIKEDSDPSHWEWSTVIDGIGPVTSSIANLQNQSKGILWLFFGTGRYYFETATEVDDATGQRVLYGVKEPCFSSTGMNTSCTSTVSGLTNVTDIAYVPTNPDASAFKGWYINLDLAGNFTYCERYNTDGTCAQSVSKSYRTERVITDPLATVGGLVYFTSYKPYDDICALGGKSFIWVMKYNTGGTAVPLLKGQALLQVSTGSIEQKAVSPTVFSDKGGRRTTAMEGVPPTAQGLSVLTGPPAVKRVIHIRER